MQEEKNPIVGCMCKIYNVNDFVWVAFTVMYKEMCLQIMSLLLWQFASI